MIMRTAIAKPKLLAALSAISLGALVSPAMLAASAFADPAPGTTGAASTVPVTAGGTAPSQTISGKTLATWFGPGFYGHLTACGQTMSPTLVGVASRTLPCGTLVQLGYRGHRLTVPVLDRGPYGHSGAVWDLTAGAARALKIKETVRIAAQIVGNVPNAPTLGLPPGASAPVAAVGAAPAAAAMTGGAAAG
jgi:rare lipoprotein A (peptidoglycan hydrolase)